MSRQEEFWVHVQQPTVPHYRLAFFDAVAARLGHKLCVSASRKVSDGPTSVLEPRDYLDLEHPCDEFLGGRALWQRAMLPNAKLRRGDVVVVNGNPRFLSTLKFAYLARRRGVGVVWWGHGWSPTSRGWTTWIRGQIMRVVQAVLLYTDEEAVQWRARLPATVGVFGAQNAIDQSVAQRETALWSAQRAAAFRLEQGLEERKVLLFCGRLRTKPYVGVDLLLQALARLTSTDASYLAVIIGDGEDRARLQGLAQELGVAANVRWLGAQYAESANAPWFLSATCFVYPGPIGLSLLHAMGYGLPVITHGDRRRHNPEIAALRNGWNGFEFTDADAGDLADKIARLAQDPALRSQMSANARLTAYEDFSLDQMADRFCAAVMYARRAVGGAAAATV